MWTLSATDLIAGYADGSLSPVDVMQSILDRVTIVNPAINALFEVRAEEALAEARLSEARWRENAPVGLLDGVPVTIKDSVAAEGWPYWRGMRARVGTPFSTADSPPAARLKEAGAIIFAKTTMPDFGLLASGVSSAHGITRNPWNLQKNTGGSSSGGGAALAAGLGPLTVGSDLAGSVRLPAAHCGLFTLKPGKGVVPHLPPSATRVAGPITRTVLDAALMLSVLSLPDGRATEPGASTAPDLSPLDVKGLKIGLLMEMGFGPKPEPEVAALIEAAAAVFEANGATIMRIAPPFSFDAFADLNLAFSVKAALERDELPVDRRGETLDFMTAYCDAGDRLSAKAYLRASETVDRAKKVFSDALSPYDFVLSPVMAMASFAADALGPDPALPSGHVNFTGLVNQVGWPAASICCGFTGGMPVGLQIIGGLGTDMAILGLARTYEMIRGFDPGFPSIG